MKCQTEYIMEGSILHDMVMEKRSIMPRLGGRKLYFLLSWAIRKHNIRMGRDKFFVWLKQQGLLIKPKKRFVKTTHSHHRFRVHKNLILDIEVSRPNQVWVSDITYLRLQKGFCYLALITDVSSRKIIGWDVSTSLELSGCIRALKMACRKNKYENMIHHSDRGIQYCSNQYVQILKNHNINISMGEAGNCYENAIAERVNGILKSEFNVDVIFKDVAHAQKAVKESIRTYNEQRPHMSLGMRMPNELYAA